jgi:transposase
MAKLNEEARMTIKTLARKGLSNRQTARLLGVSEGTVRYQRKRMEAAVPDGRSRRSGQADAYAACIEAWRETKAGEALNLALLHQWLVREYDYPGSLRSIERYWKKTYPAPKLRARRRVETPPGAQSQVDWAHFPGVVVGGEPVDLVAFRMVLSHSRYSVVVWSHKKDQLAWHRCHNEAFRRIGGVTATVRVDNEKTAVVRGAGPWGQVNAAYRRYARMLYFHVDACLPREPQTKGKVERSIRTQRFGSEVHRLAWRDLDELQAYSDARLEAEAHRRRCPATGTSVYEAWQCERALLTPLPDPLWEPFDLAVTRPVTRDALVSFEGRQYNVPFAFAGGVVEVRGCAQTVQVLSKAVIIAVHPRHSAALLVIDPRHYEGPSTDRVVAPPPLGRLGRRMLDLASATVAHRSIDYYHALAEVAR